jgi:hypothetical protein
MPHHREIINRAMAQCAPFAIVTTKGQDLLGVLAEIDRQAKKLSAKIAKPVSKQK